MPHSEDERQIVDALLARAEEQRRRILDEAKAQAAQIVAAVRAQVTALREERVQAARRRAGVEQSRRMSAARVAQIGEETRLLNDAVERAIVQARQALAGFRYAPDYPDLLGRLLDQCLEEFPTGAPLRVIVDARDEAVLARVLAGRHRAGIVVEVGGPFLGGLMVSDEDGHLVVDNTFETRLRSATSDIRRMLAGRFTQEETGAWPSAMTISMPASRP